MVTVGRKPASFFGGKARRGRISRKDAPFFECDMNTAAIAYFRGSQRSVLRRLLLAQNRNGFNRRLHGYNRLRLSMP